VKGHKSEAARLPRSNPVEPLPDDLLDAIDWDACGKPLPETPNWLDATDYPTKLSPRAWGWEFLRRNPDYLYNWSWSFDTLKPGEFGLDEAVDPSLTPYEPAVLLEGPVKGFRAQAALYPKYLRLIDAREAGASIGDISRILLGKEPVKGKADHVQKMMRAADQLLWDNYRFLLMRR